MPLTPSVLQIDTKAATEHIAETLRRNVLMRLRRKGAVVAVSGGIDSSVCAALCALALGKERVLGVAMPDRDSSPESTHLARLLAERLEITLMIEDISPLLEAAGCYRRQEEAIRMVVPEYGPGWKSKIMIPSILSGDRLNISRLVVEDPERRQRTTRMNAQAYLQLVAATNFKQRARTMLSYYQADKLDYAVCGTPNRLEYDQGFFVKGGDGLADMKPIAHLYKTQVYQLGQSLGVPDEILSRKPTTDTFSLEQTQEEFYFSLPYEKMDLCLWAHNHDIPAEEAADATGLAADQVRLVYTDIEAKRRHTAPLHLTSLLCEEVPEIDKQLRAGR